MTMQLKRNGISGEPIEIRPFATFKQDKAINEQRIRISEMSMAGRRIAEENPELARWFLLHVMTSRETAVEKALHDDKIEGLVLREPEQVVVRRGRTWTLPGSPWLPGFVLVRCVPSTAAFRGLLAVRHVVGIVGGWERPYRVPDNSINEFNKVMQQKEDIRERDKAAQEAKNAGVKAGDRVKIMLGPFKDFEATVLSVAKGRERRCKLQYKLFGRDGEVNIPLANLSVL